MSGKSGTGGRGTVEATEAVEPDGATGAAAAADAGSDSWEDWADLPLEGEERTRAPLFLGREIYRRRRIMDAARLLPALGTALLLLPMLWARDHGTAAGVVYLFIVWFGLILIAGLLSRRLAEPLRERDAEAPSPQEDREAAG